MRVPCWLSAVSEQFLKEITTEIGNSVIKTICGAIRARLDERLKISENRSTR